MKQIHGQLPLFEILYSVQPTAVTIKGRDRTMYRIGDVPDTFVCWDEMDYDQDCEHCGLPCTSAADCYANGGLLPIDGGPHRPRGKT